MTFTPRQYATALLDSLTEGPIALQETYIKNFFVLLRKHKKYSLLPAIVTQLEKISNMKEGLTKVTVESAAPLTDVLRKHITYTIGGKVLLEEKVERDLLAGIKFIINDSILIDASGESRIKTLFSL